jgi:hypothetical protein
MAHPALIAAAELHILSPKLRTVSVRQVLSRDFAKAVFADFRAMLEALGEDATTLQAMRNGSSLAPREASLAKIANVIAEHTAWPAYDEDRHQLRVPRAVIHSVVAAFYQDYGELVSQPRWLLEVRDRIFDYYQGGLVVKSVKVVLTEGGYLQVLVVDESYEVAVFFSDRLAGSNHQEWLQRELEVPLRQDSF